MKISLAMIVKNEEKYLKRCLDSVKSLVDEMIVVDTGSTDGTLAILQAYPQVKVFHTNWENDFSKARNFSLEQCTGDYVLVVDADEYVVRGKRKDLEQIASKGLVGQIEQVSKFEQGGEVQEGKVWISRFFPSHIRYVGAIHEQPDTELARVQSKVVVKHDGYIENVKGERNIPLLVEALKQNPNDAYYLFQLGKEYRIAEKYEEAFRSLLESYKLASKSSSYYVDLVVEILQAGKQLNKREVLNIIEENKQSLNDSSDFHFTCGLFYLEYAFQNPQEGDKYLPYVEASFLKCLTSSANKIPERISGTSSYLASYNLGVYYEVTGQVQKAKKHYRDAAKDKYERAVARLAQF